MKALMRFFVTLTALALLITLNSSDAAAQKRERERKNMSEPSARKKPRRDNRRMDVNKDLKTAIRPF